MTPTSPAAQVLPGRPGAPLFFTCEHAGRALPPGVRPTAADRPWMRTHWAWDPGAAALCRGLARRFGAAAVLAPYSRLWLDPNRGPADDTLIRAAVEGHALSFNRALGPEARAARIASHHAPYHAAAEAAAQAARDAGARLVVSCHTFTPNYLGQPRTVEMGVLFDESGAALGRRLCAALAAAGWDCRENEPWSGMDNLIYGPARAATAAGLPYLEIELRNDLATDRRRRAAAVRDIGRGLEQLLTAADAQLPRTNPARV
jgi:predicted N-formylglutamate amidohydrolase